MLADDGYQWFVEQGGLSAWSVFRLKTEPGAMPGFLSDFFFPKILA